LSTQQRILILGGSGFLSGTLARRAVAAGHQVWTVTRGQRGLPAGVTPLVADRHDAAAFAQAIAGAQTTWDLVVDCIAYDPADIGQDIDCFASRAHHLIFVSTDFVYDPARRRLPQAEEPAVYAREGYGGKKRLCELALMAGAAEEATREMQWTVARPCHIYGPGSLLGCLPLHGRDPALLDRLRAGEPLRLAGGGYFLQQPILARDLADSLLGMAGNPATYGQVFNLAGPDTVACRTYYQIIAEWLGVALHVEEAPVAQMLAERPETAPFLCHRFCDLGKLAAAGVPLPSTPLAEGLAEHVASLQAPQE
jgi:nucleoside-diphosphate-sugar epimerase